MHRMFRFGIQFRDKPFQLTSTRRFKFSTRQNGSLIYVGVAPGYGTADGRGKYRPFFSGFGGMYLGAYFFEFPKRGEVFVGDDTLKFFRHGHGLRCR